MNYDVTAKGYACQNFCLAQSESRPALFALPKALVDEAMPKVEHSTIEFTLVVGIKLDAVMPALFRASRGSPWTTTSVSVRR
jgi:hypothetical protein